MIDIVIFKNMFTEFVFGKWLIMASCVYGLFRLVKMLVVNR